MHFTAAKQKYFFSSLLAIFLSFPVLSSVSFAQNQCIQNITAHIERSGNGRGTPKYLVLRLDSCYLHDRDMGSIVSFLKQHPEIISLDLSNNFFTVEGISTLAEGNLPLTMISVSNNNLGDKGAAVFVNILGHTQWYSTYLNLSENRISDEGIKILATNTTWKTVRLEKNNIGDEGVSALASNPEITNFYLSHNNIGDQGALALSQFARLKQNVTTIDVRWNHIDKQGLEALYALRTDHIIANLDVDDNP